MSQVELAGNPEDVPGWRLPEPRGSLDIVPRDAQGGVWGVSAALGDPCGSLLTQGCSVIPKTRKPQEPGGGFASSLALPTRDSLIHRSRTMELRCLKRAP